jgi:GntR family transcriptional regulator
MMSNSVSPVSPLYPAPLYLQLAGVLRQQIAGGTLPRGEPIPTEADLCQRYQVSRATVRQALSLLVEEGLIVRQRGRGSIVAPRQPLTYAVSELRGFTEILADQGLRPRMELLAYQTKLPPEDVSELLELDGDAPTLFFERLVRDGDGPILLDSGYIPAGLAAQVTREALAERPIYRLLEAGLGVPLAGVHQTIGARSASEREAALLEVRAGAPLLEVSRLAYLPRERPVFYSLGLFRADRYQERLWLRRPGVPTMSV